MKRRSFVLNMPLFSALSVLLLPGSALAQTSTEPSPPPTGAPDEIRPAAPTGTPDEAKPAAPTGRPGENSLAAPTLTPDETKPPANETLKGTPLDPQPPLGLFPTSEDRLMDPRMARSWGAAPARMFLSTTVDVGFIYLRPRVAFGYGKPFTSWIGVEANPIITSSEIAVYGGVRLELPYFDLRVGPRHFYSLDHTYLDDEAHFTRLQLETSNGAQASATTYEAEINLSIPVGPGNIIGRGSLSYVSGVPDGQDVFEETLHVIVRPPWVWRARIGYAYRFGTYKQHSIGLIGEVLDVPRRDDSVTLRVGPLLRFVLSRRVELRASFVVPVISPDSIGIIGGDFAELGVRYRWATE